MMSSACSSSGVFRTALIACAAATLAPPQAQAAVSESKGPSAEAGNSSTASATPRLADSIGVNYFSFFNGPGLDPELREVPPNQLGRPSQNGLNAFNLVSIRYKLDSNLGLDLQSRFRVIFNNGTNSNRYQAFQWETPRIGVSGKLAAGEDWSLTGAVNTDFPYFLPSPLSGYTAQKRTVVFNPGTFANFRWNPRGSRWSVFSVVAPRYFFYQDRDAAEPELTQGGFLPGSKPELAIAVSPTLNYLVTSKLDLSLGTTLDYRKQVLSSWNPLNASLQTNGSSDAWRLEAIPLTVGISYSLSPALRIFPYLMTFPIAAQRTNANTGGTASLLESSSFGMWLNGTLL